MGNLRDVEEAGDAADIDEGAVGLDRLNDTLAHVADAEALAGDHVRREAVGHDEAVLLLVNLEELHGDGLPDEILAVGHAHGDVRLGDETAEVLHLDEEAAAVDGEHHGVDRLVSRLLLAAAIPSRLELREYSGGRRQNGGGTSASGSIDGGGARGGRRGGCDAS